MKFVAIIEYGGGKALMEHHQAHRTYLRTVLESGRLYAAGPFEEDRGAIWILDAESAEAADAIVGGDPLVASGVITSWRIRGLAYWSAREAKGSR